MDMLKIFLLYFLIFLYKSQADEWSSFNSTNARLSDYLLHKHSNKLRPVRYPNQTLVVNVLATLYQIVDVNQRTNLIDMSAYFDLWWEDAYLHWNPDDYDNVSEIYLPADDVWTPDLYLFHSVQGSTPLNIHHSAVRVNSSGTVRILVPFTAKAFCPVNVKYFPFEKLSCWFNFGSWSFKKELIEYRVAESNVSLSDFYDNQEWVLLSSNLSNNESVYNNSYTVETYSIVTLFILMERNAFYYVFNLIVPTTLVTIVSVIGFHAAANSTERRESKFRLGIMTLLSMGVLLLNVVDNMPKFSMVSQPGKRGSFSDVPLLGIYYLCLIGIISLCTCTSSLFVTLEIYALHHPNRVPIFLNLLSFQWPWQWCVLKKTTTSIDCHEIKCDSFFTTDVALKEPGNDKDRPNDESIKTDFDEFDFNDSATPLLKSRRKYAKDTPDDSDEFEMTTKIMNRNFRSLLNVCQNVAKEIRRLNSVLDSSVVLMSSNKNKNQGLTPQWDKVICRIERLSLAVYLSCIAISLCLFFTKEWY